LEVEDPLLLSPEEGGDDMEMGRKVRREEEG